MGGEKVSTVVPALCSVLYCITQFRPCKRSQVNLLDIPMSHRRKSEWRKTKELGHGLTAKAAHEN
jgi:hypothetical protein